MKAALVFIFLTLLLCYARAANPMCSEGGKVTVTETVVDADVRQLEWLGEDSSNIEALFMLTNKLTVWRSLDEGKTWEQVKAITESIAWMYTTNSTDKLYFLSNNGNLWKTADQGRTYTKKILDFYAYNIRPHPTEEDWALSWSSTSACRGPVTDQSECRYDLYLTKNFRESWTLIHKYVARYSWGQAGIAGNPRETIYVITWANPTGDMRKLKEYDRVFQRSRNLFSTGLPDYSLPHAIDFLVYKSTIFYAALSGPDSNADLDLYVSLDAGTTFAHTEFPTSEDSIRENSYTILDVTEDSAFVNVDHQGRNWGTTYGSGGLDREFVRSVKHNRRYYGIVDFRRVLGLDGIYVANKLSVDDEDDDNPTRDSPTQTIISFDKGSEWSPLKAPTVDANGAPISCSASAGCGLHLFGPAESSYGQFYTYANAIGLILSTGAIGTSLPNRIDEVNTYFSRDAGLTWYEVAKGEYTYEFGDHGAIVILVSTSEDTATLKYSWNEGLDWTTCDFSSTPVDVTNVRIEMSSTARNFLIYGTRKDQTTQTIKGVIIHVDFENFHQRECVDEDYEEWSPSDALGGDCLLGGKYTYTRRKREAACFNPHDMETKKSIEACICTEEDFECDFCYERSETGSCDRLDNCVNQHDEQPPGCTDTWFKTQGYRKISDDICIDTTNTTKQWGYITMPCNGGNYSSEHIPRSRHISGGAIFGIVLLVILAVIASIIVGLVVAGRLNQQVREQLNRHSPAFLHPLWDTSASPRRSSSRNAVNYNVLGGSGSLLEDSDDDDESGSTQLSGMEKDSSEASTGSLNADDNDFNPRSL